MRLRQGSFAILLFSAVAGCSEEATPPPPSANATPPPAVGSPRDKTKLLAPKTATFRTFEPGK